MVMLEHRVLLTAPLHSIFRYFLLALNPLVVVFPQALLRLSELLKVIFYFCHVVHVCCDISGSLTDRSIFNRHIILEAIFCSCHHLSISAKNEGLGVTSIMCSFWMDFRSMIWWWRRTLAKSLALSDWLLSTCRWHPESDGLFQYCWG